ncbi:hypothetical protein [Gottfriedia solisilvae]|uniref:Uncharacterized protein n=1 Tax=Gottfriedia solisilvae TaxID=1516104 RepID=A0A8J3AWC6_9BACI|nr:hypothetical protein [Gottfriedia solisilvae]GGI18047.1 hypothetical protein GCM10007380_40980 [Gottfriedia solisilvae]
MKKPYYLLLIVISVLALFLGGFQYTKMINNKPSREIWVGYNYLSGFPERM